FNPAAERIFGRSNAEALGHDVAEMFIPSAWRGERRAGVADWFATSQRTGSNRRIELRGLRPDGSEFPVELTIAPIEIPDGPPLFTASIRDLSERNRQETAAEERVRLANLGIDVGNALIQDASLPQMLRGCCEAMIRNLDGAFARIWSIDE